MDRSSRIEVFRKTPSVAVINNEDGKKFRNTQRETTEDDNSIAVSSPEMSREKKNTTPLKMKNSPA